MALKKIFSSWGSFIAGPRTRWASIFIWILLVGIVSFVWPQVNDKETESNQLLPEDVMSVEAANISEEQFSDDAGTPLLLVWYRDGGLEKDDLVKVQDLYTQLQDDPVKQQAFIPPLDKAPPEALLESASEDGTALTTPVFFEKDASTEKLGLALDELQHKIDSDYGKSLLNEDLDDAGLHLRFTGPVGIQTDAVSLFSNADITLLISTVLIVLILLIVLYRSPLLAVVPLVAVGMAYGLISPLLGWMADKGWIVVDGQVVSIMTVLLFGAGTDYCLFLVSRYRDELRMEPDKYVAMKKAISGTGGAIMISAMTTALALLALGLAYYASYDRFAIPFSLAIFIMGVTSLTLLPAILALLGRVAFFPFIPRTEAMTKALEEKKGKLIRRSKPKHKFGELLGRWGTEKPWIIIITCVILFGGLGTFVTKMEFTYGLLDSFPEDMPSREGFSIIADHYPPGEVATTQVIVDREDKDVSLEDSLSSMPMVEKVGEPQTGSEDKSFQEYEVTLAADPYSGEMVEKIPDLQSVVSKQLTKAGVTDADNKVWIGGETATLYDTEEVTSRDQGLIIPVVLIVVGLLLLAYLRSIVAMIYLLLTVILSYFAALGLGWILIHYGMGVPAMQGLIPLYTFVFLVALGEDYNIFLVSSIWKKREHMSLKQAISEGVKETSSVISSAGLILAGTFAVLATMPLQVLVHFGMVTAIGILLDTFIVRPLLVPAITTVLGRYAFWPGKLWKKRD